MDLAIYKCLDQFKLINLFVKQLVFKFCKYTVNRPLIPLPPKKKHATKDLVSNITLTTINQKSKDPET